MNAPLSAEPPPDRRFAAAHVFVDDLRGAPALSPDDDHHLRRVLRLRAGEWVSASDGAGSWRWCRMTTAGLEAAGDVVTDAPASHAVAPIAVGFALVKGDRPEWIVQKLTELGVDRIVPFESAHTVVHWRGEAAARHLARLSRVAREAAMQSRRTTLPEITTVRAVRDVLAEPGFAVAEPGGGALTDGMTGLAVGPEGGFTSEELSIARHRVGLPGGVLRAETAAIAAGVLLASRRALR